MGCLCGWAEDQGNWFLTKCVLDLIQLLHFSPPLYLHRNHLRWVNFRGQPSCEKLQSPFVHPGIECVCLCVFVDNTCMCLKFCTSMRWVRFLVATHLCCYMGCPGEGSTLRRRALWLSVPHTCTHTHQILTVPFYTRLWRGGILMTVNSPDNSALSIFRQYYSVVKWTNTQRMRLLAGLMMPDWLAAADARGDEDVIYPFLSLSLSHSFPLSLCLAPLSLTPSFIWKLLLCSFALIDKSMFS